MGNPDYPGSHFATICKPGSGWAVKRLSALDTPAYTGEQVPEELLPLLVSSEWVDERKKRWGVTSPIYRSKLLGEFPDTSDDTPVIPKWIEAAQARTIKRNGRPVLAGTSPARCPTTKSGSSTLEPRTTGACGRFFEAGEIDIDELDDVLAAKLGSIKWTIDSRGRIKIESKDDMRKRGLPSPDRADTLAMVMSRRSTGGPKVDVESHPGESITGDLMQKAW